MTRTIEITKLRAHLLSNMDDKGKRIPDWKVAAACNMSGGCLSKYATGQKAFSHAHLKSLCRYFHLKPSDMGGWLRFEYSEDE